MNIPGPLSCPLSQTHRVRPSILSSLINAVAIQPSCRGVRWSALSAPIAALLLSLDVQAKADPAPAISTANSPIIADYALFAGVGNLSGTIGWQFQVGSAGITISSLGVFDHNSDGLLQAHQVGIWNSSGTLLTQTTVGAGTSGTLLDSYRYQTISSLTLSAGQTYTIGTFFSGVTALGVNDDIIAISSQTFAAGIQYLQSRQTILSTIATFSNPTLDAGVSDGVFGPTFQFDLNIQSFFWDGRTDGDWRHANWATTAGDVQTALIPDAGIDVVFSTTNATGQSNTTLGKDFTIHSLTIQDPVAVSIGGANTLTIAGAAGTGIDVQAGAGKFTMDANLTLGGSSDTITVNNTAGAVINGVIGGTNGLIKAGTGTLTLNGTNTYTGGTHVDGGVLEISNDRALGTSGFGVNTILADGTELRGTSTFTLTHSIFFPSGAGTSATLSAATGTVLTVSDLSMQGSGKAIFGSTGNTGVVAVAPSVNFAAVSSTASIEVAYGTLRNAGGLNNFTGGAASTTVEAGATLDANGLATTIANLQGAGTLTNDGAAAATLTINAGAFSGTIQDGVSSTSIIKNGPGTLALTGDNTFSGSFTVNDGTVQIQSNSAAISGDSLIIGDGVSGHTAVVQTTSSFNNIYNNAAFAYTTVVTIDNNGTLDLNGFHESIGSIASATGVAAGSGLGTISLGAGGFLNVGVNNASTTFNGTINGTGAGIVTKLGTGAWTLTSASTYTGSTNINAGTLLANNTTGSATGTSTVAINSGGTLGGNGTVSGPITVNSGGFIRPGAAATGVCVGMLHGTTLTWNGGGQLNLQLGTTSDLLALTGPLTKGTAGTFGVEITDAGGILNQTHYQLVTFGSQAGFLPSDFSLAPTSFAGLNGFFTLTGTELDFDLTGITTTGSTIQNSLPVGTPKIADFIINGPVTTGGPNENNQVHTLTFLPGGSLVVHNTLFVLQGPVTLPGGSTLTLDGSLSASQLKMLLGSLLNGNGNILGNLFNGGLVSPGHSPGQIHVSGDYTQSPTGTLRIEIAGRDLAQHDLLSIGGKANLDGALQIVPLDGFKLKRNKAVTFLTANGGVNGEFATIDNGFTSDTILTPTVVYHDRSVALEAVQGSFAALPHLTPNQKSVARALDSIDVNDHRANSLFEYLDYRKLNKLPGDFDKIAPEELTSIFTIGTSLANVQSHNIQRRTDDIRTGSAGFNAAGLALNGAGPSFSGSFNTGVAGPSGNDDGKDMKATAPLVAAENRWGAFLSGTGEWVRVGNTDNARGYDLTSGGFTLGIDYKVTPNFAVGLAAGYTGTSADLTDRGRVYVNGGKIGLYATFFQNEQVSPAPTMSKDSSKDSKEVQTPAASIAKGFYADVAVFGGYNSYDTRRTALQGEARGDTDGGELNVLAGIGYDFKKGNLTFGPTASFNYTYLGTNGFTEHGSLAPLNIHGGEGESLRTAFGFKASYDWKVGSVLIKPEIRVSWQHEFGDAAYALDASFANGAGNSFLVNGPELGRDSVLLGAGFAIQFNERFSTYFYYDGELGRKDYQSTAVTGGFRLSF